MRQAITWGYENTMGDIAEFLRAMGIPSFAAALIAVVYIVFDKGPKWFSHRGKSEREMLSTDQNTFRRSLMDQIKFLTERTDACERRHDDCEKRLGEMYRYIDQVTTAIKDHGLGLMMDLSPPRSMDGTASPRIEETRK